MRKRKGWRFLELTHLSLFSGIGGIDLAAEAAGFTTVCQCEWADFPASVLERHWPDVPRFSDIRSLTGEAFYERTGRREVTLLSGGFPCQPFSSIGFKRGFADPRYLWPEMCRVVKELRPRFVLGENVANFVNMGLEKTLADLEAAGYEAGVFVVPACAVGAWHERSRAFIVGVDVSHSSCIRYGCGKRRDKDICKPEGGVPQREEKRFMDGGSLGDGVFFRGGDACGILYQPGMGGMDDGVPGRMDGSRLWAGEPEGNPRVKPDGPGRAKRLTALGNAVVPAQIYPILKCIADMETGRCRERCVWERSHVLAEP